MRATQAKKKILKAKFSFKKSFGASVEGLKILRKYLTFVSLVALFVFSTTGGAYAQSAQSTDDAVNEAYDVPSDALFTPPSYLSDDIAAWKPMPGDTFEVNVETNMGRLIHKDGESVQFEVVSGVRRVVYYIGHRYFAATPAQSWVVHETVIKRDRRTFGKTGRFIRLYKTNVAKDGTVTEESTPYGIHPFGREDSMFKVPGRYGSMGCIILREKMEDVIQKTIETNGGSLNVRTFPVMAQE